MFLCIVPNHYNIGITSSKFKFHLSNHQSRIFERKIIELWYFWPNINIVPELGEPGSSNSGPAELISYQILPISQRRNREITLQNRTDVHPWQCKPMENPTTWKQYWIHCVLGVPARITRHHPCQTVWDWSAGPVPPGRLASEKFSKWGTIWVPRSTFFDTGFLEAQERY